MLNYVNGEVNRSGKLMDEMHCIIGPMHYSIPTERSCSMWVKRYVAFLYKHVLDRHKNLRGGLVVIFILDPSTIVPTYGAGRINRIDWIYCFLGFHLPAIASSSEAGRWKPRNSHPAFSGKRKPKRPVVLTRGETSRIISLMIGIHHLAPSPIEQV